MKTDFFYSFLAFSFETVTGPLFLQFPILDSFLFKLLKGYTFICIPYDPYDMFL